jgi:nucleotide-binding universal stress UspA family protein
VSYQTIAIHLDTGPRCATRVALAIELAKTFHGTLVGVAPTGLPDVTISMNPAIPDAIECVVLSATTLRQGAEAAAAAFERDCAAAGVAHRSSVVVGTAVDATLRAARCSDLVIVGQTDRARTIDGVPGDLPQQLVLQAGAPVLVVPYAGTFGAIGAEVLMAWKNTREAARALRDSLPLLDGARQVTLAELGELPRLDADDSTIQMAAAWLRSHGVPVHVRRDPDLGSVGERLLSLAAELGCDLIVAGGYGHSRLREWALGGVTRQLLQQMTVPTLLSH